MLCRNYVDSIETVWKVILFYGDFMMKLMEVVYPVREGGALPYKPIRDVPFFGVSFFQHKFLKRV